MTNSASTPSNSDTRPESVGQDEFDGGTAHLRRSIAALLALDDDGALRPHGIGGHAHKLLTAAFHRLAD